MCGFVCVEALTIIYKNADTYLAVIRHGELEVFVRLDPPQHERSQNLPEGYGSIYQHLHKSLRVFLTLSNCTALFQQCLKFTYNLTSQRSMQLFVRGGTWKLGCAGGGGWNLGCAVSGQ